MTSPIIADLHIHSRFSRATSKSLDFVSLHRAALEKGITLVGTGDFTHPGWMAEIEDQLEPAEEGLFKLRPDLARKAEAGLPRACAGRTVRFVLQVEISNIYKKMDRVRKNHNLVYVPSLDAARRFTDRLAAAGNVVSDGRPILGLDARDLLEITLETDPIAFLIPAHIWTPWFSLLGSKSGFDSLEACFGDLSSHIFAAETGLSSDPPMNWRVSSLDRLTLVSNSDAHSPANLGREANLLEIELSYPALYDALKTRSGYLGTVEFYPEEGKYHLDGHRKCNVRLDPEETRALDGRCPVCGGKLTVGVMSRVLDLADRPAGARRPDADPFSSLVPLAELVGECLDVGSGSKRVRTVVTRLLDRLGPELEILMAVPVEEVVRVGGPLVAEAVRRARSGKVIREAGYDGAYGRVRVFEPDEKAELGGQLAFLSPRKPPVPPRGEADSTRTRVPGRQAEQPDLFGPPRVDSGVAVSAVPTVANLPPALEGLNDAQLEAARTETGPLLVVAGPGTGKTRTLVARMAYQVTTLGMEPERVLAIAFTRQAAAELGERIAAALDGPHAPMVTTFHGFGRWLLEELGAAPQRLLEDDERLEVVQAAMGAGAPVREARVLLGLFSLVKQSPDPEAALVQVAGAISPGRHDPHEDEGGALDPDEVDASGLLSTACRALTERSDADALLETFRRYQARLRELDAMDVDDLVLEPFQLLSADSSLAQRVAQRFVSVSVDEYQDVNDVQAALLNLLCPDGATLCAIGDPDQAIYGFRGSRPGHFRRFARVHPDTRTVHLRTTYRLTRPVLEVARAVLPHAPDLVSEKDGPRVELVECPTAASEAEQVLVRLERIIGGSSYFSVDTGRGDDAELSDVGLGDVAILTRTRTQQRELATALGRSSIPCRIVGADEPHDPRSQKVAIMTMHAAKGREFEVVFVTGVERGLVPLALPGFVSDPEEERRLLYVALTRARRLAVVSHAAHRTLFGKRLPAGPSPFLERLPSSAVRHLTPALPRSAPTTAQLDLFAQAGARRRKASRSTRSRSRR